MKFFIQTIWRNTKINKKYITITLIAVLCAMLISVAVRSVPREISLIEYERFLHDLRSFGVPVYDFDVPGELTTDKALYKDPYHADEEVKAKVVDIVWGEGL